MTHKSDRSRNFCFTINNYSIVDVAFCDEIECKYIIYGYEIGESGTKHLQGYIMFKHARSFNAVRKLHKTWHLEIAKGSPMDNFIYCSKDKNFVERGKRPKGQGKRSDIDEIKELVKKDNVNILDIYERAASYQAFRFGEKGLQLYGKKRCWKTKVFWYFGSTGTGKSLKAFNMFPDAWVSGEVRNGFFFDGYNGEEVCIFDDFRPQDMTFSLLLKVFDRYPLRVRTLGGSCHFVAKTIIVTTNLPPEEFYNEREDIGQLLRRIEVVSDFDTHTEVEGNTRPRLCVTSKNLKDFLDNL